MNEPTIPLIVTNPPNYFAGPLIPPKQWRARLAAAIKPLASGALFTWCPTVASRDLEPRVRAAQFGDGYAQRRPDGINTQDEIWTLDFSNRPASVATAIDDFLKARNGVDVFVWTPPRQTRALNVICPEWSLVYGDLLNDGTRVMGVSAKFQEVHQ
jgi:phage-related protein